MAEKSRFDLEQRTLEFSLRVREFARGIPRSPYVEDDIRQLIRASGSVGANCIEANESLGRKDFRMRIKICRKEAKEAAYWLRLVGNDPLRKRAQEELLDESNQLMRIFGAILRNTRPRSREEAK